MLPVTESTVRASFVNASRKEVSDMTLPPGFADTDFAAIDHLGWTEPRMARRAYVVVPVEDRLVGLLLRRADASPRSRAQCAWCQDVTLPNDVAFWSAKRSGASGRNGNTVGTLVCEAFQCSVNVRRTLPPSYLGHDVDASRAARIAELRQRATQFALDVLG